MLNILVTDAVLYNGTVVKVRQKLNMAFMAVTDAVLNNGAVVKA